MNDVDDLIQKTLLVSVLHHFGRELPLSSSGEHRMQCVFRSECADSSYGQLAVNQDTPAKVIYCHTCGIRGNLLTLLHGLDTGRPPTGDKLRGDEFKSRSCHTTIGQSSAWRKRHKEASVANSHTPNIRRHKRRTDDGKGRFLPAGGDRPYTNPGIYLFPNPADENARNNHAGSAS